MDPDDASSLLLRVVNRRAPRQSETVVDKQAADALVQDFGFLALAIVHAGAYIAHSKGMSISHYRKLFLKKRQATLERYKTLPESSRFDDYDKTVYTTWNMCYELLGERGKQKAQELLWLIAFLHHDGITMDIFQRAATNIRLYAPVVPATELEKGAYAYLHEYLTRATGPEYSEGEENRTENSFLDIMGDLAAHSLVEYDEINAAYTIPTPIQDWVRAIVPHESNVSLERTAALLAISIGMNDDPGPDSHDFSVGLGPHVKRILSDSYEPLEKKPHYWEVNPNHAACFANVFRSMELWHEEEGLRIKIEAARRQLLGLEHPITLQSIDDLAQNYVNQGHLDTAEDLYTRVLELRRKLYRETHGDEHDDILASKKYLASIYQYQGRLGEAMTFWEDVVWEYRVSKGGNNLETLACMNSLTDAYLLSVQLDEAEKLQKDILNLIPDDDPEKPVCIRRLAEVLELKGEWNAAELQLIQYQEALKKVWGESHANATTGQQYLYEFRVRRESVPPIRCDACTFPAEIIHLRTSSTIVLTIVRLYQLWNQVLNPGAPSPITPLSVARKSFSASGHEMSGSGSTGSRIGLVTSSMPPLSSQSRGGVNKGGIPSDIDNGIWDTLKLAIEPSVTSQQSKRGQGLNILCIDGGGVRGLSSLLLLKETMYRLKHLEDGDAVGANAPDGPLTLRPSDWFDIIAGTGTGGVIACMLGKLQMPIEDAIESYTKLMKAIFQSKQRSFKPPNRITTIYNGDKLKESLKSLVMDAKRDVNEKMVEDVCNLRSCNTIVFATSKHHVDASVPVMFRSYPGQANPAPNCTTWECMHATIAHPRFFKSSDIIEGSVQHEFIGGDIGNNNPLPHVLAEVRGLHPGRYISSIVSIGAGRPKTMRIPDPGNPRSLQETMYNMATDSEQVAEAMERRFWNTTEVYFRFNVDQGIQDIAADEWKKANKVAADTRAYLNKCKVNDSMNKAVGAIYCRSEALAVEHIDGRAQHGQVLDLPVISSCPMPTTYYTDQVEQFRSVAEYLVDTTGTNGQKVCVIHGLGGAGKSQLAFKVVEQTHDFWEQVIYMDATSQGTIERTLRDFAKVQRLGSTHSDTRHWLERNRNRWLLVFDGADDPNVDISRYFPSCFHGSILITTRLPHRVNLARPPSAVYELKTMKTEDASALLLKIVNSRIPHESYLESDKRDAIALVNDFDFLALAIVQAGAYIAHSSGMTISRYHEQFRAAHRETLERYKTIPKIDEYGKTVYTTWNMCYRYLKQHRKAQELLWLIAFLDHNSIPIEMFQRAAANITRYSPDLPQSDAEICARNYLHGYLIGDERPTGGNNWVESSLENTMGALAAYSLVGFDKRNETYNIHVLVQDWATTLVPERSISLERTALFLSASIGTQENSISQIYRAKLGPHIKKMLSESGKNYHESSRSWEINNNHAARFATVFKSLGLWQQQAELLMTVQKETEEKLGPTHPATLQCTDELAHNYKNQLRLDDARKLYEKVLERRSCNPELGDDHEEIQASKKYLALVYQAQGRFEDAERFWMEVVAVLKRRHEKGKASSDQASDRELREMLASMDGLAEVYLQSKQLDKGESQLREMLKSVPHDTVEEAMYMRKLANVLESKGLWDDAEKLLLQSSDILNLKWGKRAFAAIEGQELLDELRTRKQLDRPLSTGM
ncbi:Dynein heavy chain 1, axonemal [Rhizoctonia solani]|uniref:Dynein heavy chain 1, axonemal n=1 Tax=Rhizoctonia solani TaxID=456999 RepID=A0A0K6GCQ4_9AGAM|nr:Dynein heavy chain 1, axonemal [Rhizoctonia solani]